MGCMKSIEGEDDRNTGQIKVTPTMIIRSLSINCILKNSPHSKQLTIKLISIVSKRTQKSIKNITLAFRASEHKFKATLFHQKCSKITNTVFIAWTTQNNIFGAFTPCSWQKDEYITYSCDDNKQSFLFRVIGDEIKTFNIKQGQQSYAIMNDQQLGPVFGQGHDIHISNEADKIQSWNNQGKSYACDHRFGSIKANTQLCDEQKYKLKEYQIWQVQIQ